MEDCTGTSVTADDARQVRIVEREGRRRRRREARNKCQENISQYYEGLSSDDELLQSTENKLRTDNGECVHYNSKWLPTWHSQ